MKFLALLFGTVISFTLLSLTLLTLLLFFIFIYLIFFSCFYFSSTLFLLSKLVSIFFSSNLAVASIHDSVQNRSPKRLEAATGNADNRNTQRIVIKKMLSNPIVHKVVNPHFSYFQIG